MIENRWETGRKGWNRRRKVGIFNDIENRRRKVGIIILKTEEGRLECLMILKMKEESLDCLIALKTEELYVNEGRCIRQRRKVIVYLKHFLRSIIPKKTKTILNNIFPDFC